MSRQIACPNCGGEHSLVNPGITMLVCSYCKTVVYWGDDEQLQIGTQSILPEADTRLYMDATGKLDGRTFTVAGHLLYDHGRGRWDEWYLQFDDGGIAWLSEDERELTLEQAAQPDGPVPGAKDLRVSAAISLGDQGFTIREIGKATCVGGEGQLPFTILPGESYAYADVASQDGQQFGTIEYDDERPTCFVGQLVGHEQLQIDDERPPSTASATHGKHIKCTNCAGALEMPAQRNVETLVCEYCGAQLDLTSAERTVLGINSSKLNPRFTFEIAEQAQLNGQRYEVCGRMLYEDAEGYETREYLLYNAEAGYQWLAEEDNHFVLNRPTQQAPARSAFNLTTGQQVRIGSTTFRFYEQGTTTLVYVDGALPWLAKVGDRFQYADLTAPPQLYSVESDGSEVEYFYGRYMPAADIWAAFNRKDTPPRSRTVHAAQPFVRSARAKLLMTVGLLFAALNLGLVVWSLGVRSTKVFEQEFTANAYLNETVSKPFQLPACSIVGLHMQAPVSNSWLAVEAAFINDKNEVVGEMDNAVEYYFGYDGGESWSEGSNTSTNYFRAPESGTYRLIIKGSGGSGNSGPPKNERLRLSVSSGVVLTRYFFGAFIICALFPFFEIMRRSLFEKRRWGPVTDDDDDDDSSIEWGD